MFNLTRQLKNIIIDTADEMVYDQLYFGYFEFDDEDISKISHQINVPASEICKVLKIKNPLGTE
ncbi:hypothetical protein UFOVP257_299 [uncultured Caudovirales phage]|uniref:Uncharacterized protein n=1 Tax=uncultured Caudovirales phage TaxID=2100421 RepID=A0A6J5LKG2_9CAUD|nr:hypothetical protein UFOVP257_299 [uncultured Caudovirales phage]